MVLDMVKKMLAEHVDMEASEIREDTTFESLGVDSLDTVEMVMELEEELGVELELNEKVETVGALVKFIESRIGK